MTRKILGLYTIFHVLFFEKLLDPVGFIFDYKGTTFIYLFCLFYFLNLNSVV